MPEPTQSNASSQRPNVIVIMVDDLGFPTSDATAAR